MKTWKFLSLIVVSVVLLVFLVLKYYGIFPAARNSAPQTASTQSKKPVVNTSNVLTFCADPWPPFNNNVNDKMEGYVVEIIRAIYEPLGYKVIYINKPWARCIEEVRAAKIDAIIGASLEETPDFVFEKHMAGNSKPKFFVLPGCKWRYNGLGSLKNIRLGIIEGYNYNEEIFRYVKSNLKTDRVFQVGGTDAMRRLIDALLEGRIDALIENDKTFYYTLKQMGLNKDIVNQAGDVAKDSPFYVPFSPKRKDAARLAAIFDKGIEGLRASGKLAIILQKYGIEDWDGGEK